MKVMRRLKSTNKDIKLGLNITGKVIFHLHGNLTTLYKLLSVFRLSKQ